MKHQLSARTSKRAAAVLLAASAVVYVEVMRMAGY